ncbi:hypothetical protein EJ06DRAFT_129961 [Trichodelitschia bisporula]|uniref:Rho-GAP domain-containing protein n=1 Tax=Trichodelitschia bisporula TaxID=703511 RepID=A0A6G1HP06_9PEZI|nr:hypothetical protein EJ06DRAFT_129961 [Trichodelitschia bisporula]
MPSLPIMRNRGPRGLFARFFVKPYEQAVQNYGDIHELARLGGVSTLTLPDEYTVTELVIPTRFAATAQFLADYGGDVQGLFRIPGQQKTVIALREHFASHVYFDEYAIASPDEIESTVRLACLPSQAQIPYTIHDVSSTFKQFLNDLDGGILGSVDIFESLRHVLLPIPAPEQQGSPRKKSRDFEFKCRGLGMSPRSSTPVSEERLNARLIARILCSIECPQRRNLIFSVFGLLALLEADSSFSTPSDTPTRSGDLRTLRSRVLLKSPAASSPVNSCPHSSSAPELGAVMIPGAERMSARALGVVFAPILLGDMADLISIEGYDEPDIRSRRRSTMTSRVLGRNIGPVTPKRRNSRLGDIQCPRTEPSNQSRDLGDSVKRTKLAAGVIEGLIRVWPSVVKELKERAVGREAAGWVSCSTDNGFAVHG